MKPTNDDTDMMATEGAPEPGSAMGEEGSGEEEQPNVTPEEQAAYDKVVVGAQSMIWSEETMPAVLGKLRDFARQKGPAFAIGHTAAMILASQRANAEEAGEKLDDELLLAAGAEVVAELLEIAVAAKLVKPADEERVYNEAMPEGTRIFGEDDLKEGRITPERQKAAMAEMQGLLGRGAGGGAAPAGGGGIIASKMGG